MNYGIGIHNLSNKTKDAIKIFEEMLELDPDDHLVIMIYVYFYYCYFLKTYYYLFNKNAKSRLLRCFMDAALAEKARQLIEKYPNEKSACFLYTKALIEHISLNLNEPGSSVEIRDQFLTEAFDKNPYVLWIFLFSEHFENKSCFDEDDDLLGEAEIGTLHEAFQIFDSKF